MSSHCRKRLGFALAAASAAALTIAAAPDALAATASAEATMLRVCADPDNLPYSRLDGIGF
jgi:hypothetical protein